MAQLSDESLGVFTVSLAQGQEGFPRTGKVKLVRKCSQRRVFLLSQTWLGILIMGLVVAYHFVTATPLSTDSKQ
jgi:hypothetical protein